MTLKIFEKSWLAIVAALLFIAVLFALSRQAPAGPLVTTYESPT